MASESLDNTIECLSDMEARFERVRRVVGLWLAPLAFLSIWFWQPDTLSPQAHHLAAVMAAVVVLWVTEALPMPVTALLAAAACVVLKVAKAEDVFDR